MAGEGESEPELEFESKVEQNIYEWAKGYARERGWILNPNKRQLAAVIRGLARNKLKWGEQYCPCRIRTRDLEKDKEIICPCVYHGEEIEQEEHCHCQLFFKVVDRKDPQ
ncbi:MAG: ferredoxin-thioredoxin reductase catalytic domain-containing protein [Methanomicrobiales archaeon]|nr:ferredoxin-thioredoxin reductase catalytic domain-containing protein [Methanomicrobiales archaeon]MDI6875380.1 ferredoxin-thioredoxin reductase catalytic domain-containing protein [Methanomicrobiales archaeon]